MPLKMINKSLHVSVWLADLWPTDDIELMEIKYFISILTYIYDEALKVFSGFLTYLVIPTRSSEKLRIFVTWIPAISWPQIFTFPRFQMFFKIKVSMLQLLLPNHLLFGVRSTSGGRTGILTIVFPPFAPKNT